MSIALHLSPETPQIDLLKREANLIHKQLFEGKISEDLRQKYVDAHTYCDFTGLALYDSMQCIILNRLDVEAIEYAARGLNTALTRKIHLFFYLVEIQPSSYSLFINSEDDRLRAFFLLFLATARSVFKKLKGHYLIWRFQLV